MSDVNQIISLGIGTPSSIKYFVLVGLGIGAAVVIDTTTIDMGNSILQRTLAQESVVDRTVAVSSRLTRTLTGTSVLGED